MKLHKGSIYYPENRNNKPVKWLCISAHQDDCEIMAIDGVLKGYYSRKYSFALVETTDGAGSARKGPFQDFSDEQMKEIRISEQQQASEIGKYHSVYMLNYSSQEAKDEDDHEIEEDFIAIIKALKPKVVYTHSLLDKHPTHLAVAIKAISALRKLPKEERPEKVYGCEVWRGLDWVDDERKIGFDVSRNPRLQKALIDVFASQVAGGKDYTKASICRRYQNATYYQSHSVDRHKMVAYAIDLTPLIKDPGLSIKDFALSFVDDLRAEISDTYRDLGVKDSSL
ncbi:MAG: PIG-L family deacetylase [Bacilli bacterium]|nr:PIG-L family deacetylase [Bacilli bacterium]